MSSCGSALFVCGLERDQSPSTHRSTWPSLKTTQVRSSTVSPSTGSAAASSPRRAEGAAAEGEEEEAEPHLEAPPCALASPRVLTAYQMRHVAATAALELEHAFRFFGFAFARRDLRLRRDLLLRGLDLLGRAVAQQLGVEVALQPDVGVAGRREALLCLRQVDGVVEADHVRARLGETLEERDAAIGNTGESEGERRLQQEVPKGELR